MLSGAKQLLEMPFADRGSTDIFATGRRFVDRYGLMICLSVQPRLATNWPTQARLGRPVPPQARVAFQLQDSFGDGDPVA